MKKQRDLWGVTIERPLAQAFIYGPCRIIGKTWTPPPGMGGQLVVVHAGKRIRDGVFDWLALNAEKLAWNAPPEESCEEGVLGMARYSHAVSFSEDPWWAYSFGPYGLVFSEVFPFREVIRGIRGQTGLWPVTDDLRRRCRQAWKEAGW